jgi:hypothetical protein
MVTTGAERWIKYSKACVNPIPIYKNINIYICICIIANKIQKISAYVHIYIQNINIYMRFYVQIHTYHDHNHQLYDAIRDCADRGPSGGRPPLHSHNDPIYVCMYTYTNIYKFIWTHTNPSIHTFTHRIDIYSHKIYPYIIYTIHINEYAYL